MAKQLSIFVIVPALNEEQNVAPTIDAIYDALPKYFEDVRVGLFNDGSTDRTGAIAEESAKKHRGVQVIHHDRPRGLGYIYKAGIKTSPCEFVLMIPGDNEITPKAIEDIAQSAGKADIIVTYPSNPEVRPLSRQIISKTFVAILNLLFRVNLKYYNGCVLHRTKIINSVPITTDSFAYQAEALIKLIRNGRSHVEVGMEIRARPSGRSKAFTANNIFFVCKTIVDLMREVYGSKNGPRSSKETAGRA